jgi:hypothetical protein
LYEKDGEKYFVVDGHVHYWDASPGNWIEGQEQYAKGWIECFYGYHQLGPEEYYWPMEKYQKYSEETMMKDLFEDGYVDKAIFLPTSSPGTRRASTPSSRTPSCRRSTRTSLSSTAASIPGTARRV